VLKASKMNDVADILKEMTTIPDAPLDGIAATPWKPMATDFSATMMNKPSNKIVSILLDYFIEIYLTFL
jgi:hypothetical protein